MATRKFRKFSEGGEAADKEEGLKASKGEKVGFLERMRMGNIDEEGSEAYNRFGAGRAKADRDAKSEADAMKAVDMSRASAAKASEKDESAKPSKVEVDELEEANKRKPISVPDGEKVKADTSTRSFSKPAAKASAKPSVKVEAKASVKAEPKTKTYSSNYSNEGRGREMSKAQQAEREIDSIRPSAKQTQQGLETAATMMGGAGLKALHGAAKKLAGMGGKKAAESGGGRALSTAVDDGVTYLGKSGRRQVGGFDEVASSGARQIANNPTRQLAAPPKQIGGPTKANLVAKNRAARAASRKESMNEENAARHGLNRKDPDFDAKASEVRRNLGGDDFSLGYKRGGNVKSSSSKPAAKGWGMARGARAAKMR